MIQTSLQTITWGDPQHDRFDEIFSLAKASQFTGLEIGFRRLSQLPVAAVNSLLDRHGLTINASHIGGNLGDLGQAENERKDFDDALQCLVELGVPYLLYSGLNEQQDDALDAAIDQLNEFAGRAQREGVQMLFHNHDWEFHKDRRIWDRLRDQRSDALGYALDLGWAAKTGQNLSELLDEIAEDVRILHFKDFVSDQPGQNTCHLGEGIIDFESAWAWLAKNGNRDLWITAEQDNAPDAAVACAANGVYLNQHLPS